MEQFCNLHQLLESKIFNTMCTLILGGILLNWISHNRSKKEKVRDKTIEFLDKVAHDINGIISRLYGQIREQGFTENSFSDLYEKSGTLFLNRFSVKIKSEAYLNSHEFSEKYDLLVFEINALVDCLFKLSTKEQSIDEITTFIINRKAKLSEAWALNDDKVRIEKKLDPIFQELMQWNNMIYDRAITLLVLTTKKIK